MPIPCYSDHTSSVILCNESDLKQLRQQQQDDELTSLMDDYARATQLQISLRKRIEVLMKGREDAAKAQEAAARLQLEEAQSKNRKMTENNELLRMKMRQMESMGEPVRNDHMGRGSRCHSPVERRGRSPTRSSRSVPSIVGGFVGVVAPRSMSPISIERGPVRNTPPWVSPAPRTPYRSPVRSLSPYRTPVRSIRTVSPTYFESLRRIRVASPLRAPSPPVRRIRVVSPTVRVMRVVSPPRTVSSPHAVSPPRTASPADFDPSSSIRVEPEVQYAIPKKAKNAKNAKGKKKPAQSAALAHPAVDNGILY